jgi:hypothetical protein
VIVPPWSTTAWVAPAGIETAVVGRTMRFPPFSVAGLPAVTVTCAAVSERADGPPREMVVSCAFAAVAAAPATASAAIAAQLVKPIRRGLTRGMALG